MLAICPFRWCAVGPSSLVTGKPETAERDGGVCCRRWTSGRLQPPCGCVPVWRRPNYLIAPVTNAMPLFQLSTTDPGSDNAELIPASPASLAQEANLECWLERSPWAIAQEPLLIIGRQPCARYQRAVPRSTGDRQGWQSGHHRAEKGTHAAAKLSLNCLSTRPGTNSAATTYLIWPRST